MLARSPAGRSHALMLLGVLVLAGLIGCASRSDVPYGGSTPWVGWLVVVATGGVAAWFVSAYGGRAQTAVAWAVLTTGLAAMIVAQLCLAKADPGGYFVFVALFFYVALMVPLNWWIARAKDYRGAKLVSLLSGLLFLAGMVAFCRYAQVAGPFEWVP